jgi:phosphoglycolate phosphatase
MPAPLAIFDLDGTLVDSRTDLAAAGNAARAALGLPPLPLSAVVAAVGDGVEKLVERLTPDADAAARRQALASFRAFYAGHCCDHTAAYDGIPAALDHLAAAGWTLAVATNKAQDFSLKILAHLKLDWRFAAIRGGDRTRKPDPGQLQEVLHATGADPARAWMIGDHHTDLLAGRAAGMKVAWCAWGLGHAGAVTPDRTLDRPLAIAGLTGHLTAA